MCSSWKITETLETWVDFFSPLNLYIQLNIFCFRKNFFGFLIEVKRTFEHNTEYIFDIWESHMILRGLKFTFLLLYIFKNFYNYYHKITKYIKPTPI